MQRFHIRAAQPEDEDALLALARHLNSVNLPDDRAHVRRLLAHAHASFSGTLTDPRQRKYVFLLWDEFEGRALGTSMIVAQLGRKDAPYIYVDVSSEEKYSPALDKHFHHTRLVVGYSYDGPTELGGLVVTPEARLRGEKLGQLISYVRFLYIAMHRPLFQDELLAELLPPLEPDGTSKLWEAVGRRFTGLSYAEADRLSSTNKEFIKDLFPSGVIYASLLPEDAQAVIGKVGAQTRGVEKLLRRIGFRYAERVDPFDGGPHFTADTDDVTLVREARPHQVRARSDAGLAAGRRALLARSTPEAPFFRAVLGATTLHEDGALLVPGPALTALGAQPGDEVWCLPLR